MGGKGQELEPLFREFMGIVSMPDDERKEEAMRGFFERRTS